MKTLLVAVKWIYENEWLVAASLQFLYEGISHLNATKHESVKHLLATLPDQQNLTLPAMVTENYSGKTGKHNT